jgi:two-component system sensor histidine kinase KdpD
VLLRGGDLRESLAEAAQRLSAALELPSASIELGVRDGDERSVAFPLREGSSQIGTLVVTRDVPESTLRRAQERVVPALEALLAAALERDRLLTDVVETAALRRSDVVKTALLRAVSHDLRSPLTGIRTAIGALRNGTLQLSESDRTELLDTIQVDSERLSRLVGDLLDLSRLEAGGAAPDRELWSLDDIVRDAVDSLGARDRVEIVGESPLVEVDAGQIQRVLANLIENAIAFSPPDLRVVARITATRKEAIVRIVDQGAGLPEAELERVFEPFYRRSSELTGGAGLGLAIARGFGAANGGRVWAESRPDQGATFALALPVVEAPVALPA